MNLKIPFEASLRFEYIALQRVHRHISRTVDGSLFSMGSEMRLEPSKRKASSVKKSTHKNVIVIHLLTPTFSSLAFAILFSNVISPLHASVYHVAQSETKVSMSSGSIPMVFMVVLMASLNLLYIYCLQTFYSNLFQLRPIFFIRHVNLHIYALSPTN